MHKDQRVRDVVHGLIVFRQDNDTDRVAWELINTREFQRLRRIRQLGFSEFVFPGATHTRFSHCIGAYHTARQLLHRIEKIGVKIDARRSKEVQLATLLHDVGHGPFSHTFQDVQRALGVQHQHEDWSARIVEEDTEIRQVLEKEDKELPGRVAALLRAEEPADLYASIVSSQFDADRLDYLRRDRYMTGTGLGGFDYEWLLDCLSIGKTVVGDRGQEDLEEVDSLCLNHKALQSAEDYLLARFHLYVQVYLHKTTRSAEKMLLALLVSVADRIRNGDRKAVPIPANSALVRFLGSAAPSTTSYLLIDDFSIWNSLQMLMGSADGYIAAMSRRLIERKLFKCFDVSIRVGTKDKLVIDQLKIRLRELTRNGKAPKFGRTILLDDVRVSAYGYSDFGERDALRKVLIRVTEGGELVDVGNLSRIVGQIGEERLVRLYVAQDVAMATVNRLWREVSQ